MRIVDAQIHVWDKGMEHHAEQVHHRPDGAAEIVSRMDAAGVARAVIVPPNSRTTPFSVEVANAYEGRFAVMAIVPLDREEGRAEIEQWQARDPHVVGVRLSLPPWRPTSWLRDGTADWFWPQAEAQQIPVMIWAPEQWDEVRAIAERHPDLRFIVDHFGLFVDVKDDALDDAIKPVLGLSSLANVGVKLTALPCHSTQGYPFANLHRYVELALETFGSSRLFWGSDMTRLPCPYSQAVSMFTESMSFLSGEDLDNVMGASLSRWLNWP